MTFALPQLQSPSPCELIKGGCGRCCNTMKTPPFVFGVGYDDISAVPEGLQREINAHLDSDEYWSTPEDHPCLWLDPTTKLCKHYAHRPLICREYTPLNRSCWIEVTGVDPGPEYDDEQEDGLSAVDEGEEAAPLPPVERPDAAGDVPLV